MGSPIERRIISVLEILLWEVRNYNPRPFVEAELRFQYSQEPAFWFYLSEVSPLQFLYSTSLASILMLSLMSTCLQWLRPFTSCDQDVADLEERPAATSFLCVDLLNFFLDNTMNDCHVSEGCSVCNVVLVSGHLKQFVQLMTKEIDGLFRILDP